MGAILAQTVIDDAGADLMDAIGARWSNIIKLGYLNEGLREAVRIVPQINAVTMPIVLVAGVNQSLPVQAQAIVNDARLPMMNKGVGGAAIGLPVTVTDELTLSAYLPGWQLEVANAAATHFMIDRRLPYKFKVYPAQPLNPATLEVTYSTIPAPIAANAAIPINDEFATALRNYICYRALATDTGSQDTVKAQAYYTLFTTGIGA